MNINANQKNMEKKEPIMLLQKTCLFSKHNIEENQSGLDILKQGIDEELKKIIEPVLHSLYDNFGLQSAWLEQVDRYEYPSSNGIIESGYVLYFDGENKHGRKSMIEVNNSGQIIRRITYK